MPKIEAALAGLAGYVEEVVADRRAHPRDDLVTTLVQARRSLTDRELSVALVFLAFAGMETTRNQLGLALQTLLQHPDQWALLAERPELGANAVEEVMRVNPTVTWVTREALEDVDFQGLHIPKGGIVQMLSHAPAPTRARCRTRRSTSPSSGRRTTASAPGSTTASATSSPAPTWRSRCRCWPSGCPDAECDGPGVWLPVSGNTGAVSFPIRFTPTS